MSGPVADSLPPPASGTAMVTSPHPLASAVGARILRRGGTAIEAAVAMGAALAVLMPHFCGLGGDAVWMIADRSGRRDCLLGIGQAARDLPDFGGEPIPQRGALSALTTACLVDSWQHALEHSARHWGGRLRIGDLLAPAIDLAENGFRLSPAHRFWLDFRKAEIAGWPGFDALFAPGGDPLPAGALLRQPALARSLATIADEGCRSFYEGRLAAGIASGLAERGSPVTLADLCETRTRRAEPLLLAYRGLDLLAPPPPTQGVTTLAIMGMLSRFDLAGLACDGADHLHLCVEAVKQAFLDRGGIADPEHVAQDPAALLDPARLARKADAIVPDRALPWPQPFGHGDTVFLAAADGRGGCASVLQSIYFDWGSGVLAGGTGILWQNRGAAFSTRPGHPNRLAPGKRPFYTLNPGIALRDGAPALLYGTQGADGQPQTLSTVLTRLIDYGRDPMRALAGPRFLIGRTFSDSRDTLKLERSASAAFGALEARGHELSPIPALSPLAGAAGVIAIGAGGLMQGAHDPRGDGVAIASE